MSAALEYAFAEWDAPSTSAQGAQRYHDLAEAYDLMRTFLTPRNIDADDYRKPEESPEMYTALSLLIESDQFDHVFAGFMRQVQESFDTVRQEVVYRLRNAWHAHQKMEAMTRPEGDEPPGMVIRGQAFAHAFGFFLERMTTWFRAWGRPVDMIDNRLSSIAGPLPRKRYVPQYTSLFHSLLHAALPPEFPKCLETYLELSLLYSPRPGMAAVPGLPAHETYRLPVPAAELFRLAVFPRYTSTVTRVANAEIRRIVQAQLDKGWEERRLGAARAKVASVVAVWVTTMFERSEGGQQMLKGMFSRFDHHICESLFDLWTDKMFEIIVEYPDSMPAVDDLKDALDKISDRTSLVKKLIAANEKRLLHPGAETRDVLSQYISTIKCLRILDPQGVLLHQVAKPIREHLRARPDTVKCIVASLVKGEELQHETGAPAGLIDEMNDDDVEDFANPDWVPEPLDADPTFRSGKTGDITSTLVSIYETQEAIIKELQNHLAERLLAVTNYDAVQEIRTVELLKLRFGETALQVCDVMLKDIADSKRVDKHIHNHLRTPIHPLILSRMFWPSIPSSALHLTPKMEAALKAYEAEFYHFKQDKHLRWYQDLGSVTIELEFTDRVVKVKCSPLQASVAELFEQQATWAVSDLASRLGELDGALVRAALMFWEEQGVVRETQGGIWALIEDHGPSDQSSGLGDDGASSSAQSVDVTGTAAQVEQVRLHWTYIQGILSNMGPRGTEALQEMLERFPEYTTTIEGLRVFLNMAHREGLVVLQYNGLWALPEQAST